MIYCNDNDPGACAWARELMAAGLVPKGTVDERKIQDIQPADLVGYRQCHFFAGILGWVEALRLAGWPEGREIWTGSCPCQPFSAAGKRQAQADERHVWPDFFRLIRERRPECILGEQVEGAIRLGWLDGVFADLEGEGYTCGAAVLGAHSVGAPHIRQRLFWVASSAEPAGNGTAARLANTAHAGQFKREHRNEDGKEHPAPGERQPEGRGGNDAADGGDACGLANAKKTGRRAGRNAGTGQRRADESGGLCNSGRLGNANGERLGQHAQRNGNAAQDSPDRNSPRSDIDGSSFWSAAQPLHCRDGKARRFEPGIFPLADGISASLDDLRLASDGFPLTAEKIEGRVGLLRGSGNAIVPQVAAGFIRAFLETERRRDV